MGAQGLPACVCGAPPARAGGWSVCAGRRLRVAELVFGAPLNTLSCL